MVSAMAQNNSLAIQLANNNKVSLLPGVTANVVISLINSSTSGEQVSINLEMPKGWKCFSELKNISAPAGQSTLKILSINIPSYTLAAGYVINIEATDGSGKMVNKIVLPLTVEPRYALKIEKIVGPDYVFAGDKIAIQYMIQNQSNTKAEIDALLRGAGFDEKMRFVLNPDSSVFITREIEVEKGILKSDKRNISLTASFADNPEEPTSLNYFYNVIPGSDVKFDPYNRFPVQFSTFFLTDNPSGKREYALMADVFGQGFIDKNNTKLLRFHLVGPDRRGQPLYGIYDEYFLEYISPVSRLLLGDQTYRLSYLTEFARYGRGAQAEHTFNHFTIGSFINYPRFFPKVKREIAAYATYSSSKKLVLNLGYLNKLNSTGEVNNLTTFGGIGIPFKWLKLEWEYAMGSANSQIKQAVKTEVDINISRFRLFYHYTWAEKDYPGYFSDTRNMTASANIRLTKKLNFGANYSRIHQNMALDTIYGSAPFSKNLNFNLNYALMKNASLSVGYYIRERKDRMEPMLFNYIEKSMRVSLSKSISNLRVNLLGGYGKTENLLLPENERLNDMYKGQFSANYQVSKRLGFSGFVDYQASKSYNYDDYKNWTYNVAVNGLVSKTVMVNFNYQSSYRIEDYSYDRNLVAGRVIYAPSKNNRVELSSRYYLYKNEMDVKQLAFEARFVHTFNVPISKKKNIGKLTGRVINKGVNTVEGIVISIGASQAVTDKNGNYSFPMLPAGEYYLMMDYSKAGLLAISEIQGPYRIEIFPQTENHFDIGLTQSGNITGAVSILKEVADEDKNYAAIREQLGKLLVEAKCGDEMRRIFTNPDGTYSFEGLRPGEWEVKVYENGIPKEYELLTGLFKIGLKPGQTEIIEVKVKEIRRVIKFQQSFNTVVPVSAPKNPNPVYQETGKGGSPVTGNNNATGQKSSAKASQATTGKPVVKEVSKQPEIKSTDTKSTTNNLEYRIQIGACAKPLGSVEMLAKKLNINEKIKEDLYNGVYIYTIGSYSTQHEAVLKNKEFRKLSSSANSFIVSFRDGKRTQNLKESATAAVNLSN